MAAIMECQIIPQNTIITWLIRSIEKPQTQIKQTYKQIDAHIQLGFFWHSWLSNPPNQEAPKLLDKEYILHSDQNDNWNINSDRNYIKTL